MGDPRGFTYLLCGRIHAGGSDGVDEEIARLAGRQEGFVARRQLRDLGVTERAIDHRIRAHRLLPRFRGVYAVGHDASTSRGLTRAALLSTGPSAAASHWTTAFLRGLIDDPPRLVHVTSTQPRRPQPGLALHRGSLPPDELTIFDGIPMTSVPRTLLDLSGVTNAETLRRLVKRAEFKRQATIEDLAAILARYPRRRGRRNLAQLVAHLAGPPRPSRSEFEDRFIEFCRRFDLPLPETNVELDVGGLHPEVDCVWRDQRLIVELDSRRAHETASAFEDDRARDRALVAAGWRPARVTWSQLHGDPARLAGELRSALA